jgi:hypothetical protein
MTLMEAFGMGIAVGALFTACVVVFWMFKG